MHPRRAAAVMVAVTDALVPLELAGDAPPGLASLRSSAVHLAADGEVTLDLAPPTPGGPSATSDAPEPCGAGAALGRWFFELLVGRRPVGRTDAFEPAVTSRLDAATCALLSRALGDHPPQWPSTLEWADTFERLAGGLAPPEPPTRSRRRRRRDAAVAIALVALVVVVVALVWSAPRWWADAVGAPAGPQAPLASS